MDIVSFVPLEIFFLFAQILKDSSLLRTCKTLYRIVENSPKIQYLTSSHSAWKFDCGMLDIFETNCVGSILLNLPFSLSDFIYIVNRRVIYVYRNPIVNSDDSNDSEDYSQNFLVNGVSSPFPMVDYFTDDFYCSKCTNAIWHRCACEGAKLCVECHAFKLDDFRPCDICTCEDHCQVCTCMSTLTGTLFDVE
jgi:hypothetical protein